MKLNKKIVFHHHIHPHQSDCRQVWDAACWAKWHHAVQKSEQTPGLAQCMHFLDKYVRPGQPHMLKLMQKPARWEHLNWGVYLTFALLLHTFVSFYPQQPENDGSFDVQAAFLWAQLSELLILRQKLSPFKLIHFLYITFRSHNLRSGYTSEGIKTSDLVIFFHGQFLLRGKLWRRSPDKSSHSSTGHVLTETTAHIIR